LLHHEKRGADIERRRRVSSKSATVVSSIRRRSGRFPHSRREFEAFAHKARTCFASLCAPSGASRSAENGIRSTTGLSNFLYDRFSFFRGTAIVRQDRAPALPKQSTSPARCRGSHPLPGLFFPEKTGHVFNPPWLYWTRLSCSPLDQGAPRNPSLGNLVSDHSTIHRDRCAGQYMRRLPEETKAIT